MENNYLTYPGSVILYTLLNAAAFHIVLPLWLAWIHRKEAFL